MIIKINNTNTNAYPEPLLLPQRLVVVPPQHIISPPLIIYEEKLIVHGIKRNLLKI